MKQKNPSTLLTNSFKHKGNLDFITGCIQRLSIHLGAYSNILKQIRTQPVAR